MMFLDMSWVQVEQPKAFLDHRGTSRSSPFVIRSSSLVEEPYMVSSMPATRQTTRFKLEESEIHIKNEPDEAVLSLVLTESNSDA